jgi:PKD repeat protein
MKKKFFRLVSSLFLALVISLTGLSPALAAPPSNDNFADAEVIASLPFSALVDITEASVEPNEPLPTNCYSMQNTVWYTFTPGEAMVIRASVDGSAINTNLNVYLASGAGFSNLAFWGCNSTGYLPVVLTLEAGQTYYLQAGSIYGETGTVQINLEQIPPPANDYFANAEAITSLPFTSTVDNGAATRELDEPEQCAGIYNTVWYSFTPSETMMVQADTNGSTLSPNINIYRAVDSGITQLEPMPMTCTIYYNGIFMAEAGQTYYLQAGGQDPITGNLQVNFKRIFPPANDNFVDAAAISSPLPFDETVNTAAGTSEVGEPVSTCAREGGPYKSIWYAYTPVTNGMVSASLYASFNPVLAVYIGNALDTLTELGCNAGPNNQAQLIFPVDAGTTYYFQVSKYSDWSQDGSVQFHLEEKHPPANDNFVNAMPAGTLPFSNTVDITDATTEPGEPQYCYYSPNTVWYSFTPSANALVRADMAGSSFGDTILNIYQDGGFGIGSLGFLQCAYYGNSATFSVQAGVTYYLQAGSINNSGGDLHLNLQEIPPPANDNFAGATVIPSSLPFDDTVDTLSASLETGEPTPSCAFNGPVDKSVWYAFTPAESGSVSASIPSAAFTPVFAAYTGDSLASLTQVGCQRYSGNLLTVNMNAGTTYYFQVGNLYPWEQGGSMQFHLEVTPPPVANFYYYPGDPSKFDTIQFYDQSYDPAQLGLQSFTWDFGDGATSTDQSPTHKYASDGDYTVQHSVTTTDGRTASTSQVVQVRTHDVSITKITAPNSANVGQTKGITVNLRNTAYPETVQVDLYKSTPTGFVWVATVTKSMTALSGNRTAAFNFNYTFTSDDSKIGKVTFKAVATIVSARDAWPSDNEAISLQTKVAK